MLQKLALYPLLNFFCSNLTRKQKQNCNTLCLNVDVKSTLSGTLHIQKALHLVYNSSRPSMERLCVRAWERYSEGVSEWSLTDVMEPQRSSYLGNAECLSTQAEWEARRVPSGCQSVAHAPFFHALPPSLLRSLWIREEEWDWQYRNSLLICWQNIQTLHPSKSVSDCLLSAVTHVMMYLHVCCTSVLFSCPAIHHHPAHLVNDALKINWIG